MAADCVRSGHLALRVLETLAIVTIKTHTFYFEFGVQFWGVFFTFLSFGVRF